LDSGFTAWFERRGVGAEFFRSRGIGAEQIAGLDSGGAFRAVAFLYFRTIFLGWFSL
jgi:hypothetical protein